MVFSTQSTNTIVLSSKAVPVCLTYEKVLFVIPVEEGEEFQKEGVILKSKENRPDTVGVSAKIMDKPTNLNLLPRDKLEIGCTYKVAFKIVHWKNALKSGILVEAYVKEKLQEREEYRDLELEAALGL